MMKNESVNLKRKLRISIALALLLSLYLTGLIQTVIHAFDYGVSFLPHAIFLCCLKTGFNFGTFLIIFLIFGFLAAHITVKKWKEDMAQDKLGRAITYNLENQAAGNAHFASPVEYASIAQIRRAEDAKGKILGQLTDDGSAVIDWKYNGISSPHTLVAGTTGAGKTSMVIFNYCLQAVKQRHSLIITDPKGELYSNLALYLEEQGYVVRRFDLVDPQLSDGWDMMKHLIQSKKESTGEYAEWESLIGEFKNESEIDTWVNAIVANISHGKDDVYSQGSRALLKALALYIVNTDELDGNDRNVAFLNDMLRMQGVEYFDHLFLSSSPKLESARNAYATFKIASPNLYGNICTHLATGVQSLQTKIIEKILTTDDIDLDLPAQQPCAYFCRFSTTDSTYRFISALFFTLLYSRLAGCAAKEDSKMCRVPVDFVLDEFPSIGIIPGWEEKMSVMRSTGMSALMVIQSMQQLESNYADKAVTIQSNCGLFMNIGVNDPVSNKWISERIGEASVNTYTNNSGTKSQSQSVRNMKLMSSDQIYQMCRDNLILIFSGYPPIYARKFHYSLHPAYKKLKFLSENEIPNIYDTEGREARKKERAAKIMRYLGEHGTLTADATEDIPDDGMLQTDILMNLCNASEIEIISALIKSDISELKEKIQSRGKNSDAGQKKKPALVKESFSADIGTSLPEDFSGCVDFGDYEDFEDFSVPATVPVEQESAKQDTAKETPPVPVPPKLVAKSSNPFAQPESNRVYGNFKTDKSIDGEDVSRILPNI